MLQEPNNGPSNTFLSHGETKNRARCKDIEKPAARKAAKKAAPKARPRAAKGASGRRTAMLVGGGIAGMVAGTLARSAVRVRRRVACQIGDQNRREIAAETGENRIGAAEGQVGLFVRRRQRRGQRRMRNLLGGKGAGPRRDGQSRPAGAARLHHHHRGLHLLLRATASSTRRTLRRRSTRRWPRSAASPARRSATSRIRCSSRSARAPAPRCPG